MGLRGHLFLLFWAEGRGGEKKGFSGPCICFLNESKNWWIVGVLNLSSRYNYVSRKEGLKNFGSYVQMKMMEKWITLYTVYWTSAKRLCKLCSNLKMFWTHFFFGMVWKSILEKWLSAEKTLKVLSIRKKKFSSEATKIWKRPSFSKLWRLEYKN